VTAGSHGFGGSGSSEYGEPVFRDKRRIDPETGEVREPREAAPSTPAGSPPAADDAPAGSAGTTPGAAEGDGDVAKLEAELAERTADLQRLQAEYVNYKRRVDRDRELVKQNATFSVLSALLPVLDDLDRAREHGELEGGFTAVADSLERIVASQGLVKFGKPGDEFDPNFHEALMHSHSPDVTTTTCQHVISAGYQIGDRVVRPARVTVVDPEPAPEPSAEQQGAGQPDNGQADNGQTSDDAAAPGAPADEPPADGVR
jgi:molecular chaperone GrpE